MSNILIIAKYFATLASRLLQNNISYIIKLSKKKHFTGVGICEIDYLYIEHVKVGQIR